MLTGRIFLKTELLNMNWDRYDLVNPTKTRKLNRLPLPNDSVMGHEDVGCSTALQPLVQLENASR